MTREEIIPLLLFAKIIDKLKIRAKSNITKKNGITPDTSGVIPFFFVILLLALFFSLSIIFANKRRGIISSLVIEIFLLLRYFDIGNLINLLLLAGVAVAFEFYFTKVLDSD